MEYGALDGAIGIFDSGVGGLSVLRHIRQALARERLIYVADAGFAPYGDKPEAVIRARSLTIANFLIHSGAKALVIACNTATAVGIEAIRQRYPAIPVVGVEPGLKPAAMLSSTKMVGVLATSRTLASNHFLRLQERVTIETGVSFLLQPCSGLAEQIEKGELQAPVTARLVVRFVQPLLENNVDTLVLGCTHYPFVLPLIHSVIGSHQNGLEIAPAHIIDTGFAIARRLANVLLHSGLLNGSDTMEVSGSLAAYTTGSCTNLAQAMNKLLGISMPVVALPTLTAGV